MSSSSTRYRWRRRPGDRQAARTVIKALNPVAKIIETDFCTVPLDEVLDTGLFSLEAAEQNPLWFKELNGFRDHVPETEEYGIRSFVYRARRPFNPALLAKFIDKSWPGVVRSKGFFWLATRPHHVGELSQAGALVRTAAAEACGGPRCPSSAGPMIRTGAPRCGRISIRSGEIAGRK
jgi:G3E family GTPase